MPQDGVQRPEHAVASWDVFVSHRSEHRSWVEWLARALMACRKTVFLDIWDAVPGNAVFTELHKGLRCCRTAVLVATPDVAKSRWVAEEYRVLHQRRIDDPDFRLVPIFFGKPPDLPFLEGILCVDFSDPNGYRESLYRTLCGLKGRAPGTEVDLPYEVEPPPPMRSAAADVGQRTDPVRTGSTSASEQDALVGSVVTLLSGIGVPERTYRQHFMRTVNDLGEPGLAEAQGLVGMVRELASLRDADRPGDVSYGLLQFLCRLREDLAFQAPVDQWLEGPAVRQASAVASLRKKLEEEALTRILIIEVGNEADRIESYELSVRTRSLAPASGTTTLHRVVKDWDDFVTQLLRDIEDCRRTHDIQDLQIQFLVNPPLFDRKFHAIALAAGGVLGEESIVLLRHKDRVRSRSRVVRDAWERRAEAVRRCEPAKIQLIPISIGATVPDEEGLYYTEFLVPTNDGGSSPGRLEKDTLSRVLRSGIAYLYWLHSPPAEGAFGSIPPRFTEWLRTTTNVEDFPLRFTQRRAGGDWLACEGTLLWDDPLFNPF